MCVWGGGGGGGGDVMVHATLTYISLIIPPHMLYLVDWTGDKYLMKALTGD